jgi:hypothetical protein
LPAALMRPMFVVAHQVLPQHGQQVAGVVDQNPVQALPTLYLPRKASGQVRDLSMCGLTLARSTAACADRHQ